MTDQPSTANQPEKKDAPATSPSASEVAGGTKPLNQKPPIKVDPETQARVKKLLSERRLAREAAAAQAPKPSADAPASADGEKKEPPAAPIDETQPMPATKAVDATSPSAKTAAWPQPPKSLGATAGLSPAGDNSPAQSAAKPPAPSAPPEKPAKPDSPSSAVVPAQGGTAHLNRPPSPSPAPPKADGGEKAPQPDAAAKPRATTKHSTVEMRKVPRGRVAQEVWKVVFQALAGSEIKATPVEVKGLVVVGRSDPHGDAKPDLDLTPYNAREHGVSRQHAILFPSDEGPCIMDLNSTNGTWVNGLYLEPGRKYRLRNGDRVEMGALKMLLRVMAPAEQEAPADAAATQPASPRPKSG